MNTMANLSTGYSSFCSDVMQSLTPDPRLYFPYFFSTSLFYGLLPMEMQRAEASLGAQRLAWGFSFWLISPGNMGMSLCPSAPASLSAPWAQQFMKWKQRSQCLSTFETDRLISLPLPSFSLSMTFPGDSNSPHTRHLGMTVGLMSNLIKCQIILPRESQQNG